MREIDLVITSYGSLLRLPWIADVPWRLAVLDEAQAIKNPTPNRPPSGNSKRAPDCAPGTPVENRLSDLWSIFDFVTRDCWEPPSSSRGRQRLADRPHGSYGR